MTAVGPEERTQRSLEKFWPNSTVHPVQIVNGKPVRKVTNAPLGPQPQQEHLFNGVPSVPYHNMSPRQFAAQSEVWWHGRYGDDLPSESYKDDWQAHIETGGTEENYSPAWEDDEDGGGESKEGYYGIHFGTRAAAIHRLTNMGPGRAQGEEEAMERDRMGESERIPGRLFPVTLNERQFAGGINRDAGADWRRHMGYDDPAGKGIFYKNEVEDPGSISAAVPERSSRSADFFHSWNDHVLAADPDTVHPMLRWAAQQGVEHTGEDIRHPNDTDAAEAEFRSAGGFREAEPVQKQLFIPYGADMLHRPSRAYGTSGSLKMPANIKYLDENYKNTIGSISTVPHKKDK